MNTAQVTYMNALTSYNAAVIELNSQMNAMVDDGSDEYVNAVIAIEEKINTSALFDALRTAENAMINEMHNIIKSDGKYTGSVADIELSINEALNGKSLKVRKQVIELAWKIK
jgi:hypothetical protein